MDCLSLNLHIWSYVAVGSLYGVTHLTVILSEIPSLNSMSKCHSHVSVLLNMAQWFVRLICKISNFSQVFVVKKHSRSNVVSDFLVLDFH